jgi:hypothetical protein
MTVKKHATRHRNQPFSLCDVARVAKNCKEKGGEEGIFIVACVADAVGITDVVHNRLDTANAFVGPGSLFPFLSTALAALTRFGISSAIISQLQTQVLIADQTAQEFLKSLGDKNRIEAASKVKQRRPCCKTNSLGGKKSGNFNRQKTKASKSGGIKG